MRARVGQWMLGMAAASSLGSAACLEPGPPYLPARDNDPPELVSTNPPPNGTFAPDGNLSITFSERMDVRSIRPGIWLVEGERDRIPIIVEVPPDTGIPETAQQADLPYTVTVRGEQPLKPNTLYRVVLDTVLTDVAGNQLSGPDGGVAQHVLPYRTTP